MSFYGAATSLSQSKSRKTRSIIDIVTITNYSRLAFILAALAIAGQLQAQVDLPAPESETEDQTETTPAPELPPEAPIQIRPDEGSPVAGTEVSAPLFNIGRHFQLSGSLTGGYDDNVNLLPTGSPSWYANPMVTFGYQFGNPRLAMDLLTGGGVNYYFDHPNGRYYDPIIYLEFTLAYKITPRMTLDFLSSSAYEAQPEYSTEFTANRRLGNYFRTDDRLYLHYSLSHRWSSVTGYSLNALEYESSVGSAHDRLQNSFSEELRYLLTPTTTVSGEYRYSINETQNNQGGSDTQSLIAGLEQSFSPRFKADLRSGVQFRSSGNNGERISPYVETSLQYVLGSGARTSSRRSYEGTYIIWTSRYSIEESDLQQGAGRETFRTNLKLNYAVTARLSASLALIYSHGATDTSNQNRFVGESPNEEIFDITPSLRYAVTQRCSVNVGYRYTEVDRGSRMTPLELFQDVTSYSRNRYFAGVTISF
jgi:hypothetical protein